jgi:hypothetical protein
MALSGTGETPLAFDHIGWLSLAFAGFRWPSEGADGTHWHSITLEGTGRISCGIARSGGRAVTAAGLSLIPPTLAGNGFAAPEAALRRRISSTGAACFVLPLFSMAEMVAAEN